MGQDEQVCVVMVPFLAQGHLNQLLHLSRLISAYKLPVHFLGATTHIRQAKHRVHGWDPLVVSNIHFHDYPIPSFANPSPNHDHSSTTRFPNHLLPSFKSAMHLREPFMKLISDLSSTTKRIVIIHDYLMSSVIQDYANFPNSEVYTFQPCSAFADFWFQWGQTKALKLDDENESLIAKLPSPEGCYSNEFLELMFSEHSSFNKIKILGTLYDTSKVFEGKYLELLKNEKVNPGVSKNWAVGPFNPVTIPDRKNANPESIKLLNWLDEQEPNSVIYVSFGTTVSLGDDEAKEIAIGLEESGVKFIWVVREADKGDIFDDKSSRKVELPEGYEERVEKSGLGVVLRGWAPQLEILGHPSTGGFMSHCGWNSCTEGISMGVPIGAWPMHSDQPMNALLITNVLKTAMYAREWEQRDKKVVASMVSEAVRRLMVLDEGGKMRKKAEEIGIEVRRSVEEGGIMRKELEDFVAQITRD